YFWPSRMKSREWTGFPPIKGRRNHVADMSADRPRSACTPQCANVAWQLIEHWLMQTSMCPVGADRVARRHLPTKPIVDLLNDMVGREAIEVSDLCLKPLTPSRDEFQILVCELIPLALDPTFRLRPHSLDHGPIHVPPAPLFRSVADEVT